MLFHHNVFKHILGKQKSYRQIIRIIMLSKVFGHMSFLLEAHFEHILGTFSSNRIHYVMRQIVRGAM